MGSLSSVKFCPVDMISNIPDAVDGVISSSVTFAAGGQWFDLPPSYESASFTEDEPDNDQGVIYKQDVSLFYAGKNTAADLLLDELARKRHILKITDANGLVMLLGRHEIDEIFGLTASIKFNSQNKVSGLRGTIISFSGMSWHKAYEYGGA